MSIVAGVDFVATDEGQLGSGVAGSPFHRGKEDPGYATQSHDDHMRALSETIARALGAAKVPGNQVAAMASDTTGSSVIPVGEKLEPRVEYTSPRRIATRARGNP